MKTENNAAGGSQNAKVSSAKPAARSEQANEQYLQSLTTEGVRILRQFREQALFERDAAVVRVAIDLARLKGTADPFPLLADAARLLAGVGVAIEDERRRPEREARDKALKWCADDEASQLVPWERIYRSGIREGGAKDQNEVEIFEVTNEKREKIEFRWKVYTSVKGFWQLARQHWERHLALVYTTVAEKLGRTITSGSFDKGHFVAMVNKACPGSLFFDQICDERLAGVTNEGEAREFIAFWLTRSKMEIPDWYILRAKDGLLDKTTLYAMHLTRTDAIRARNLKALAARKKTEPRQDTRRRGRKRDPSN